MLFDPLEAVAVLVALAALALAWRATRRAAPAASAVEARFAALMRHANAVYAIVDPDGAIRYVTPSAERLFDQTAQLLSGRLIADLVAIEDRSRLKEFLAHELAAPGARASAEVRVTRGDD